MCIKQLFYDKNVRHSLKWGSRTQDPEPKKSEPKDPGPKTQRPRARTLNRGLRNPGPRTQDPNTWDLGTLNFFIELQNKTLKSKKSLTSKRDKAKHPLTYFLTFTIFLYLRFVSEILRKILGTVDFCLSDLSKWFAFQSTRGSLRKRLVRHIFFKFV